LRSSTVRPTGGRQAPCARCARRSIVHYPHRSMRRPRRGSIH